MLTIILGVMISISIVVIRKRRKQESGRVHSFAAITKAGILLEATARKPTSMVAGMIKAICAT